jgi:hypothetical protein
MSSIVTLDELSLAIRNSPDNRGMEEDQSYDLALHVLNFFGYSDRIIDNILEPEDRDAFYMMEDAGILTTEREETTLYDGREWRIHYWLFRHDKIDKLLKESEGQDRSAPKPDFDYADLPEDAWSRD